MKRHLVLVGLSGSGKTTVGKLVADALRTRFMDLDVEIERAAGVSIASIFATQGEPAFRRLEREAMVRALDGPPAVIASGGGWAAQPGELAAAEGRAFNVYLHTDPDTAAERVAGGLDRPLLRSDPREVLRELFADRDAAYRRSQALVETGGRTPDEVAREVAALARSSGGW